LACFRLSLSCPFRLRHTLPPFPAREALPPRSDIAPLIQAPEGLEPSRSTRCSARTMSQYDSPSSFMKDLPLIAFSSRPTLLLCGRRRGLPVLAHEVSLHAWGLRLRRTAAHSRYRAQPCCLLVRRHHGLPEPLISELDTQPTDTPVQRFKNGLTAALAWLGARVVRYAFPVRLSHSRLHAGLSRRYPSF
jgi:hypothetical protein